MIKYLGMEKIPLDELEIFPGNANIGDVPVILESLAVNSQFKPLVVRRVDGRNVIMAGNHTKLAMVEHGAKKCDRDLCYLCMGKGFDGRPRCEIFECDDEEATKINIVDNRAGEFSKRDDDLLGDQLLSLVDLTGSGFTVEDLRLYMPQEPPSLDSLEEQYGDVTDEANPITAATWGVIVTCESEEQQSELLQRLTDEGLTVRSLMS